MSNGLSMSKLLKGAHVSGVRQPHVGGMGLKRVEMGGIATHFYPFQPVSVNSRLRAAAGDPSGTPLT